MSSADRLSAVNADAPFRSALEALAPAFVASREKLMRSRTSLERRGLTEAMILRMRAFYQAQWEIKEMLAKRYMTAGADFFAETMLFFLRSVLESTVPGVTVEGERTVMARRGAMRPDISIWMDDALVAFVECKTQLGWNRFGWRQAFEDRERRAREDHPKTRACLAVMTARNWAGFGDDPKAGRDFFVFARPWPTHCEPNELDSCIVHRVEDLAEVLISLCQQHEARTGGAASEVVAPPLGTS